MKLGSFKTPCRPPTPRQLPTIVCDYPTGTLRERRRSVAECLRGHRPRRGTLLAKASQVEAFGILLPAVLSLPPCAAERVIGLALSEFVQLEVRSSASCCCRHGALSWMFRSHSCPQDMAPGVRVGGVYDGSTVKDSQLELRLSFDGLRTYT